MFNSFEKRWHLLQNINSTVGFNKNTIGIFTRHYYVSLFRTYFLVRFRFSIISWIRRCCFYYISYKPKIRQRTRVHTYNKKTTFPKQVKGICAAFKVYKNTAREIVDRERKWLKCFWKCVCNPYVHLL